MLVAAVALNGCASESNAPEKKGSATSHELAPDGTEIEDGSGSEGADVDATGAGGDFGDDQAAATPADDANANAGGGAQTFEGVRVRFAGAINPPNPVTTCDEAKADAQTKATNAGFSGAVTWEHLSVDSDCRLSTTSAGRAGWIYTFTARGSFNQN